MKKFATPLLYFILLILYVMVYQYSKVNARYINLSINLLTIGLLYFHLSRSAKKATIWIFLGLTILLNAIAGIFLLIGFRDTHQMVNGSYALAAYFPINACALISLVAFTINNRKSLNRSQALIDVGKITIVILYLIFGIANNNFNILEYLSRVSHIELLLIGLFGIIDFTIVSIVFIMIASNRDGRFKKIIFTTGLFYIMMVINDVANLYTLLGGVTEAVLHRKLVMLVSVSIIGVFSKQAIEEQDKVETGYANVGKTNVQYFLGGIVLLLWGTRILNTFDFIYVMILIVVFYFLEYYLQRAIANNILLENEKLNNEKLERLIEERTKHIKLKSITDSLTGLYNREHFIEFIKTEIAERGNDFTLIIVDIKRFKVINEIHGHLMGDKVIKTLATRLNQINNDEFVAARLGGDEFSMMCYGSEYEDIERMDKMVERVFKERIFIDGYEFSLNIRKGIARYPQNGRTSSEILRFADLSMEYYNKNGSVSLLESQGIAFRSLERRSHIEYLLSNVNIEHDFQMFFQPQVELATNRVIGCEGLIRWFHRTDGFISPAEFIPIAEDIGIITKLTDWIVKECVRVIKHWNDKYDLDLCVNINVSPRSFDHISFINNFHDILIGQNVNPNWVGVEITESSTMTTQTRAEEFLQGFSDKGIKVSIDDFGTGYSSLSYIEKFSIDELKIAKELIDDIALNNNQRVITKAIIMICKDLGIRTIAEGVEEEEQLELLKQLECDIVQGYIYGRPVSAKEFETTYLLNKRGLLT